ncbi:MAG: M48 family metalloprotease [Candidatus Heimdallarchaeota archaeon]|nr:M48 family metalloprotease [Candidatus Heimdallarchaeota archaeon]MCK5047882.1 M48 family metalloprotease [Candidatus Heimdallarchaeota archaeon]
MSFLDNVSYDQIIDFASNHPEMTVGFFLAFLTGWISLSEARIYLKHRSSRDNLILSLTGLLGGVILIVFEDFLLGILTSFLLLVLIQTYDLRNTPIWFELMIATAATYFVTWAGWVASMVTGIDRIFGITFNFSIYVFLGIAFYFFGKRFILVSRIMSPQVLYLTIFGIAYIVILRFNISDYSYLPWDINENILFANIGTYEILILISIFLYFISGWMLNVLFAIKAVDDPKLLAIVEEVKTRMGIKNKVKVGMVKAPILNAMAYGPFFDLRIAIIADDLEEFSEREIKGVIGHELAHASRHHIPLILLLSFFEMGVKKILDFPATTLDYAAFEDASSKISFLSYYLFNYVLLIFLLIFVRMLEGDADRKTKKAGYNLHLAEALYRLEGFYQGVASDFGISVNLLTNKQYTKAESHRFKSEAGVDLYDSFVNPTKLSMFGNIFVSHPKTQFRISAMVSDKVSPWKGAFIPYLLLIPGVRGKILKKLRAMRSEVRDAIDGFYYKEYGNEGSSRYSELTGLKSYYDKLNGSHIVAYDKVTSDLVFGQISNILTSSSITAPIELEITSGEEKNVIKSTDYKISQASIDSSYVMKNGQFLTLKKFEIENEELIFTFENGNGKEVKSDYIGRNLLFFSKLEGEKIIVYEDGINTVNTLSKVKLGTSYQDSTFTIERNGDSTTRDLSAKEWFVGFSPFGLSVNNKRLEEEMPLFEWLVGKIVTFYTRESFDIGMLGEVKEVQENAIIYFTEDGEFTIDLATLEYITLSDHTIILIKKDHLSVSSKIGIWWSNRNKHNYIRP